MKKVFKKLGLVLTFLFIRPFWVLYNRINKKHCKGVIDFLVVSGGCTKDIIIWAYGERYVLSRDNAKDLYNALDIHLNNHPDGN